MKTLHGEHYTRLIQTSSAVSMQCAFLQLHGDIVSGPNNITNKEKLHRNIAAMMLALVNAAEDGALVWDEVEASIARMRNGR